MLELASPNFKVGKVLSKNLIVDIQVVAPNQHLALRAVLIRSMDADLIPLIECQYRFRDSTWEYLRKKYLTDLVKDIVFDTDKTTGYRIGHSPATIIVDQITFDNAGSIANHVMALKHEPKLLYPT